MELDSFKDLSISTPDTLLLKCCNIILKQIIPYDEEKLSQKVKIKLKKIKERDYPNYDYLVKKKKERCIRYTTSLKHLAAIYIIETGIKCDETILVKDCVEYVNDVKYKYYPINYILNNSIHYNYNNNLFLTEMDKLHDDNDVIFILKPKQDNSFMKTVQTMDEFKFYD